MNRNITSNPESDGAFIQAKQHLPGGVNSPVRAFSSVKGNPLFIKRAAGAKIWDLDGKDYVDYVGSWGTAILGHAPSELLEVITETSRNGVSFGAPTLAEIDLASKITSIMPAIEMVRMVNSGTEACMSALRLARGYTNRKKIIKFSGCYHGHSDMLLVEAGSGVATLGIPGCPGVPDETIAHTLIARFNDIESVESQFTAFPDDIAAVIIEPFVGNAGFIRPQADFLQKLREVCTKHKSLLIFDEVMTGFRVAPGGAQSLFNVTPDLVTLGKIIGGGLPVGAYGGKKEIMQMVAPSGPIYQAGTLSGNPLAMAAGIKSLELLASKDYEALKAMSWKLVNGIKEKASEHGIKMQVDAEGGMFGIFFSEEPITNYEQAKKCNQDLFITFFWKMISQGIYFAPSPFEAGFVSFAHTEADIDCTIECAGKAFATMDEK